MNLQKNIMVEKISSEELLKVRSDIKFAVLIGFLIEAELSGYLVKK